MEEWNAQKIASTVSDLKRAVPGFVANVSLAQAFNYSNAISWALDF